MIKVTYKTERVVKIIDASIETDVQCEEGGVYIDENKLTWRVIGDSELQLAATHHDADFEFKAPEKLALIYTPYKEGSKEIR